MIRTFIALELPQPLKSELETVITRFAPLSPKGTNWIKPENLHLTLIFIGDVQPAQVSEISSLLEDQLVGFPTFRFTPQGLELFPSLEPRLLWLKLSSPNDDILKLNRRLLKELGSIGIQADRKTMKLHITLARLKARFSPEAEREIMQTSIKQEPVNFDSVSLFRSVLQPAGPQYSVLNKYNLK